MQNSCRKPATIHLLKGESVIISLNLILMDITIFTVVRFSSSISSLSNSLLPKFLRIALFLNLNYCKVYSMIVVGFYTIKYVLYSLEGKICGLPLSISILVIEVGGCSDSERSFEGPTKC